MINAMLLMMALAGAFVGAWIATTRSLTSAAEDRISIEIAGLVGELGKEGPDGVVSAIGWRSRKPESLHYLFTGAGVRSVGDLIDVPRTPGWHRFKHRHAPAGGHDLLARVVRNQDGSLLAVGKDLSAGQATRNLLFDAMLPVAVAALALGAIISLFVTARTLRRMNGIMAVAQAVEEGDLSARISSPRRLSDDIDVLGGAINRMLDHIDLLVSTIRRVSADVAHDLRTPLTHARHALYAARWSDNLERREKCIDMASESLAQAIRSFDAMLRLAELDSGQVQKTFERVSVSEIAERAFDAYQAEIEASGRSIALSRDLECTVNGDPDLLLQAIVNVLDNALKHTPAGASIRVCVRQNDRGVEVVVEDNGPGMTPGDIETMLRPFGRLDKTRGTQGSGLGLAIASSIAKLHNGRIRVESLRLGLSVALEIPCEGCSRD